MAEQDGAHGFLDATAAAFLARRLEHQRMRAAAVHEREVAAAAPTAEGQPLPRLSIVVIFVSFTISWSPIHITIVDSSPTPPVGGLPFPYAARRIFPSRIDVVVFPFVPVTP